MCKFRIGDRVRKIRGHFNLKEGGFVADTIGEGAAKLLRVKFDGSKENKLFYVSKFELAYFENEE